MRFADLVGKRGLWALGKTMLKGGFYIFSAVLMCGTQGTAWPAGLLQKPNGMKIDSIPGAPGTLVSIPLSVTNVTKVGTLDFRLSYDPVIDSFHSVTPAVRIADWEYLDTQPDTVSGEIHVIAFADISPMDTLNPILMPAGSGPVAYLNFKIYDQGVIPAFFTDVSFSFRDSADNTMRDSLGNLIDSSQIDYINGGINLGGMGIGGRKRNLPAGWRLAQNYPNPFNPETRIDFYLPASGHAALMIFDLLGQGVCKLVDENLSAGPHSAVWNGRDENGLAVSSGAYFYRLVSGGFAETKKMILVK